MGNALKRSQGLVLFLFLKTVSFSKKNKENKENKRRNGSFSVLDNKTLNLDNKNGFFLYNT